MINLRLTDKQAAWLLTQMEQISDHVLCTSNEDLDARGVEVEMIDLVNGELRWFDSENSAEAENSTRIGEKLRTALNEETITVTVSANSAAYVSHVLRRAAHWLLLDGSNDPTAAMQQAQVREIEREIWAAVSEVR